MSFQRVVRLFVYLSRSYYEAGKIKKWFKRKVTFDNLDCGVLYSYRFEYQPYVGLLLKQVFPDLKIVARGHRFDLYEERRQEHYIPLREYLLANLDKTIMIAQDGVDYLVGKYPIYRKRLCFPVLERQIMVWQLFHNQWMNLDLSAAPRSLL